LTASTHYHYAIALQSFFLLLHTAKEPLLAAQSKVLQLGAVSQLFM